MRFTSFAASSLALILSIKFPLRVNATTPTVRTRIGTHVLCSAIWGIPSAIIWRSSIVIPGRSYWYTTALDARSTKDRREANLTTLFGIRDNCSTAFLLFVILSSCFTDICLPRRHTLE